MENSGSAFKTRNDADSNSGPPLVGLPQPYNDGVMDWRRDFRPILKPIENGKAAARSQSGKSQILAVVVPSPRCDASVEVGRRTLEHLRGEHFDTVVIISSSGHAGSERIEIPSCQLVGAGLAQIRVDDVIRNELCDEDDDIFIVDGNTSVTDWAAQTLSILGGIIGTFEVVPIVMDEVSELSVELGHALGSIMFSNRVLVVAEATLVDAEGADAISELEASMEALDYRRLEKLSFSRRIGISGTGAIMSAMIAAAERMANHGVVNDFIHPTDQPGCVGAMFILRSGV